MEPLAREGRDLADAIGDHFNSRQCGFLIALAQFCRGETAKAVRLFTTLIAEASDAHDELSKVSGLIPGAMALAYHGDIDSARAAAATTVQACTELGFLQQNAYMTVITTELAAGDAAAALEAAEDGLRGKTNAAVEKAMVIWPANAALASGDVARAKLWAEQAVAASTGMMRCQALIPRVRVHIAEGNSESAAADAYEGLTIASNMKSYLFVPELLESLAELAGGAGDREQAVRLLGATAAMRDRFEIIRFRVYDAGQEALRNLLRNAMGDDGFDAAWSEGAALSTMEAIAYALRGRGERKRPSTGWGSLTPTELDVVRLVAEGIPNKDIAGRLFVSPRTVQTHLRHVYNKLGLASRVHLAQEAARHSKENAPLG